MEIIKQILELANGNDTKKPGYNTRQILAITK